MASGNLLQVGETQSISFSTFPIIAAAASGNWKTDQGRRENFSTVLSLQQGYD
jgi:hypothetical protein